MNCYDLARVARIQRNHPAWTWADCEQRLTDQTAEYAADSASRLAALGASDE